MSNGSEKQDKGVLAQLVHIFSFLVKSFHLQKLWWEIHTGFVSDIRGILKYLTQKIY